jgi:hydantoinase/carbamoylase family amidase
VPAVFSDLEELARIGAGADGGVSRLAWTPELFEAYDWMSARMREQGLDVEIDPAGNLLGRWDVGTGPPVLVGSHLDTVPLGGRFDGALGVVAGLHAIRLVRESGAEPRCPVWLVAFMDEEGPRFGTSLFGSRAFAGEDVSGLGDRRDTGGVTLREAMAARGLDAARAGEAAQGGAIAAYLELHVEQGPVLEHEGADVGVVTSIAGLLGFRARMTGEANHAGTTPMRLRRDAFAGVARAALALRDACLAREGMTANVGSVRVLPGGANVVPGEVEFTVDVRAPTAEAFAALEPLVRERLDAAARQERLALTLEPTYALDPLPLDGRLADLVERAAAAEGAQTLRLPSGAGHDAMVIGRRAPAGMAFVPSRGGVSHSAAEYTSPEHCELGARVLARALADLTTDGRP